MTACYYKNNASACEPKKPGTDALGAGRDTEKADAGRTFVCEVAARLPSCRDPERVAPSVAAYHLDGEARNGDCSCVCASVDATRYLQRTS